ncbi:7-deoxyloganetin glucosyltransferase-like [Castanea sativa]|uniref:7-deoxyloganetin glucosyltransferase-like n=1 Tax=Castanea sativa TaxID=21020 RepID=UPI003F652C3E
MRTMIECFMYWPIKWWFDGDQTSSVRGYFDGQDKKSLKLGPEDRLHLEGFALNVFAKADKQDRVGQADLTTDENDFMFNFFIRETESVSRASAVILNTFDLFEKDVLDALSNMLPCLYTIGPLVSFVDQIKDNNLESIGSNLWKQEPGCVEWLNSKEPNSIVYVNYGSITIMTPRQLIEFAWGLANSEKHFLWIIRPDLVRGDSAIIPPEFVTETKNRGMLASWCPQEQILKHPSIDVEWGIVMEVDNNVQRDEVEKLVRELIDGEKGKEIKKNVMEWKTKAKDSTKPGGSSYQNLDKLIAEVLVARNV